MIRSKLAAAIFAAITLGAATASAGTFNFSYTLPSFSPSVYVTASGVVTTSDTLVNGAYAVTGITGTRTSTFDGTSTTQAITGLLSPDTAYGAGDLVYPSAPS